MLAIQAGAARLSTDLRVPDSLTVGDRFSLTVSVVAPANAQVTPPDEAAFGGIAVKEWNSQRAQSAGADSVAFSYLLTTYVPKPCTIPALPFLVVTDSLTDTLRTEPVPLRVLSVLPSDTVDIRDIKPPFSAGKPSLWWLWALLVLAAAGTGVFVLVRWLQRRRAARPAPPPPPPYEEAMEALRVLEMDNLLRQGMVQAYVFRLSEILKRYLERRFSFNAQEFTTEEILAWLHASTLARPARASAEWFMRESEPVKFARFLPDDLTLEQMGREVRSFVEETRPLPPPPEKAAESAPGEATRGA